MGVALELRKHLTRRTAQAHACRACVIALIILLPVALTALGVGTTDYDDDCQGHDPIGPSLGDWLIVEGTVSLVQVLLVCTVTGLSIGSAKQSLVRIGICMVVILQLFCSAWLTVGIVVLARGHSDCVIKDTRIGETAVVVQALNVFVLGIPFVIHEHLW